MSKLFLLFYLISLILTKGAYKIEDEVLILTEKNLGYAIKEFKYLVILFYDPDCPHCEEFLPRYGDIAKELKKENFVFAKLNCLKNQKIENIYEIEAYPTLMLLIGDEKNVYNGQRNLEDIKQWLEEKTKPKLTQINTKKELDKFTKDKLCLVYFGTNESVINNIIIAERKFETMPLGYVSNIELIKSESPKEKKEENKEHKEYISIYKNFDENRKSLMGKLSYDNILKFVNTYCYPKVIEFNEKTAPIIFAKRQPALVFFSSQSGKDRNPKDYADGLHLLKYMWPRIKDKIRLFVCDINKDIMSRKIADYCNINMNNIPKIYIFHAESENPKKYEMTDGINEINIMNFIDDWSKGKLTPYIRSEPIPSNNNGEIIKLVGKTYKKEVLDNDKDVLVYCVSPWCKKCQEFEPELEKLAKKLKKNNNKLVIGKIDATLNDIDELQIHNFPTIVFYPGNAKDKEPVELKGRKNSAEILEKFILKNAYHKEILEKNSDL